MASPVEGASSVEAQEMRLHFEVSQFLYKEMDLVDRRSLGEWLDLLTDDIRYFVPLMLNVPFRKWDEETSRPQTDTAWMDEGKKTLEQRVKQLMTGVHWAEEPVSRICHLVSNVLVKSASAGTDVGSEAEVTSRFLIYRNRVRNEASIIVGWRDDLLRKTEEGWKLAKRTAYINQSTLLDKNITTFF
ncbi:3-phenylpropionate/cinnamic acid dioxygenase subunit beta [Sphingobium phenoxybenzoativorans]|uniref:Diphenyl ether 1a,2-dioxygenase small subunit n=1 Tax=Sphingobium phenoxybenzoativorans TaxID=1592790 RepID=A0A1B1VV76_9SPHN|nr:3-phenylpropionate/cinnamic acid dioxygenase subunit beta [Sphingobium phenoxybenzoativorans]ANW37880.1 DpeA2 [Sphingobium phenoxybenzoativorans]ARI47595.1 diphenyl ether 1a,2-dioxygenase small subunit [Sphingobium phenoxybenzoativorans]